MTSVTTRARPTGPAATLRLALPLAAWIASLALTLLGGVLSDRARDAAGVTLAHVAVAWTASTAAALVYASVGLILAARRPDLPFGLLCSGLGVVFAFGYAGWQYTRSAVALQATDWPVDPRLVGALNGSVNLGLGLLLIIALTILFPDGRPPSRGWRIVGLSAIPIAIVAMAGLLLGDGPLLVHPQLTSPLALGGGEGAVARLVGLGALLAIMGVSGATAFSLIGRYRRGDRVERQQLKWYAYGQSILTAAAVGYVLTTPLTYDPTSRLAEFAWGGLMLAAIMPPVATALAIRRHALFQIDAIIGGTVVYTALTAILAGLYAALTQLLGAVFTLLTNDRSDATIVLTTLVITATFNPLRETLERFVRRRFGGPAESGPGREPGRAGAPRPARDGGPSARLPLTDADLDARVERAVRRALADAGRAATGTGHPARRPRHR